MKLKERIQRFLHDEKLKRKLYVIIFESDTPAGKLFDVILIGCILVSVLLVIIESLQGLPSYLTTPFVVLEYLFTAFFTFEYLTRIYCSPYPRKYVLSFSASLTCWLPCHSISGYSSQVHATCLSYVLSG